MAERPRKPFRLRALTNRSISRRKAAGSKRNRRQKFVGSFKSDHKEK
jgi:hypothetical protein